MAPTRLEARDFDPKGLASPLHFDFSGRTAPNRFLKGAMTERLATWDARDLEKRGVPTDALVNVYRRWGEGGSGVILSGNVMFEYDHLESAGNMIIPVGAPFEGERFEGFKRVAEAAKKDGNLAVMQISHPGRQVTQDIQPNPISASDVGLEKDVMGMKFAKPRAMEAKDIERVIEGFAHMAEYASKAGWDGVQLHGAHGYLLAQFLSPTTNKRTDKYGGSLENRSRLILEIADAVRARVPADFVLGIKINSVEFQDGGFSTDDCRDLCAALERHRFDFVELSGGTYQELAFGHRRESTRKREAFFLDFAETIIPALTKTKVYVTGGLRTGAAMAEALETVHGVGLARPVAYEFDLPNKLMSGEAKSAIAAQFSDDDFGITNMAAGMQMRLVGQDKQPLDLSREDHAQAFKESLYKWMEGMKDNKDGSKYGGVDIEGMKLEPYGTPYGSAENL